MFTTEEKLKQFYRNNWESIIRPDEPPNDIINYLEQQKQTYLKFLSDRQYRFVLEVGCMDGSLLLDPTVSSQVHYWGVDMVEEAILLAKKKIEQLQVTDGYQANAFVGSVLDLPQLMAGSSLPSDDKIAVFPFNSFGNIATPQKAIKEVADAKFDILIFTYDTKQEANDLRERYYKSCEIGEISKTINEFGVLFRSTSKFHAYAYHASKLLDWLGIGGYTSELIEFSGPGVMYFGKHKSRQ